MLDFFHNLSQWVGSFRPMVFPNPDVFEVSWAPAPSGTGWYVRWNAKEGESLVYYSPGMDVAFISMKPRPGTLFLGPFKLPSQL
jgi:hypothetical protein